MSMAFHKRFKEKLIADTLKQAWTPIFNNPLHVYSDGFIILLLKLFLNSL